MPIRIARRKIIVDASKPHTRHSLREPIPAILRTNLVMSPDIHFLEFYHGRQVSVGGDGLPVFEDVEFSNAVVRISYPNLYEGTDDEWFLFHYLPEGPILALAQELATDLGYGESRELSALSAELFRWTLVGTPHMLEVVGKDSRFPEHKIPHLVSRVVPDGTPLGYGKLLDVDGTPLGNRPTLWFGFDARLPVKFVRDNRLPSNDEELLFAIARDSRRLNRLYAQKLRSEVEVLSAAGSQTYIG